MLLAGLATDWIGRRTPLPRVTLLLLFGFLIGPSIFDLLPPRGERWFPLVANLALVMVGFLLGGKLTRKELREHGRLVFCVSLATVVATVCVVAVGLLALGLPLEIALVLGGVATATDPVATVDVVDEASAEGRYTQTLLGVVALDDAWGLVSFSLLFAVAQAVAGDGAVDTLVAGLWDLGGAVAVGAALGVPGAYLSGRLRAGEPTLVEALGLVLLCGGIAMRLEVSFLLAAMVMGAVVANLARHHERPFHAIEGIEGPFMILFFVLAGASLELVSIGSAGLLLAAYVLLRGVGRVIGGWAGTLAGGGEGAAGVALGLALMPQAGVALAMVLVAAQRLPVLAGSLLPTVIAATVIFELLGPVLTRRALERLGEAKPGGVPGS